jgi:transposase
MFLKIKVMKKFFIGVDVSKLKLDFCNWHNERVVSEMIVTNHPGSIKGYLQDLLTDNDVTDFLVCAEYTGQYTYPLSCACSELGVDLWLENPTQIKYRSGVQRGKNDKLDAQKIAVYASRFKDQARLFSLPEKAIRTLKQLASERDMYVCDRAKYKGQLSDQQDYMDISDYKQKSSRLKKLIKSLGLAIQQIEDKIRVLINNDKTLSRQHQLLCSVDSVGERTAIKMILVTNAFIDFKDPRKFCCHAGVAPFSYSSGSSQHSKNKVSHRADKSIKTLLHMAALSATRTNGELHEYYERKVAEGKNKMSVINAIRAKLILRMFAVIRNDKFYEKNYINPLA